MKKIIARYEEIDNTLESFGIEKNYKKIFLFITQLLIIWSIVMLGLFGLNIYWFTYEYTYLLLHISITIIYLGILTFATFVR